MPRICSSLWTTCKILKQSSMDSKQRPSQSTDTGVNHGVRHPACCSQRAPRTKQVSQKRAKDSLAWIHTKSYPELSVKWHSVNAGTEWETLFPSICVPETTQGNAVLRTRIWTGKRKARERDRSRDASHPRSSGACTQSSTSFKGTGKQGLPGMICQLGSSQFEPNDPQEGACHQTGQDSIGTAVDGKFFPQVQHTVCPGKRDDGSNYWPKRPDMLWRPSFWVWEPAPLINRWQTKHYQ